MGSSVDESSCGQRRRGLGFLELPHEVQKEIVSQCAQSDLICLSLVSKHFRELAAAQLYRNFHIVFPDEDDPAYDSPIDGLAGGLDTFVTSDYDYAKHLRDLSLDTLSAGDKAETAYKPYLFSVSCGKFMNTLLLLTLRKSKSLETFKWNIRVELSRPVYKALHSIGTLRDVHIRMQAGPSLYETPPPLPYTVFGDSPMPSHSQPVDIGPPPALPIPSFGTAAPPQPLQTIVYGGTSITMSMLPAGPPPPPANKPLLRTKAKKSPLVAEPPTMAGFKRLRSLAVLDMDTLDAVWEIQTCIRNSFSTLTKLKLSFSDYLAAQARKPPSNPDHDDSDPEDEFQVNPVSAHLTPYADSSLSHPARVHRAAQQLESQSAVLGTIFDVDGGPARKSSKRASSKEKDQDKDEHAEKETEEAPNGQEDANAHPGKTFVSSLEAVSSRLMKDLNRSAGLDPTQFSATQQEILDTILAAARKYVASEDSKSNLEGNGPSNGESSSGAGSGTTEGSLAGASSAKQGDSSEATGTGASTNTADPSSASENRSTSKTKDEGPEDISIEEPEEQLTLDGHDTPSLSTPAETPSSRSETPKPAGSQPADSLIKEEERATSGTADQQDPADLTSTLEKLQDLQKAPREVGTESEPNATEPDQDDVQLAAASVSQNRQISDYIRETRGLRLESLSIYLVPVKASVLAKAIDLRVLRQLTLLNVGPQNNVWALLAKENKIRPLPLRKVFTDNVSLAFLTFISQLEELHEFLILERSPKHKPGSLADKTTTKMEHIRKLVLRKHLPTLKRLMIKNLAADTWDVDELTTKLICRKGKVLEELAVSMNFRAIHAFLQNITGLVNLHALHIIQLRNDDTCQWIMCETKKFLVDVLSHHPEMRLEWISIDDDDRLEKIVRITDEPKKSKKSKGKEKETATGGSTWGNSQHGLGSTVAHHNAAFPILPVDGWGASGGSSNSDNCSDEESDEDDEDDNGEEAQPKVRLETYENVHFYDVWGVGIFEKEVVTGRL